MTDSNIAQLLSSLSPQILSQQDPEEREINSLQTEIKCLTSLQEQMNKLKEGDSLFESSDMHFLHQNLKSRKESNFSTNLAGVSLQSQSQVLQRPDIDIRGGAGESDDIARMRSFDFNESLGGTTKAQMGSLLAQGQVPPSLEPFNPYIGSSIIGFNKIKSDIQSHTMSNKNSFHTDDSYTASVVLNANNLQEVTQSQFTRQSTHTSKFTKTQASQPPAAGLKTLKDVHIDTDEELEFFDEELDKIEMPEVGEDSLIDFSNKMFILIESCLSSSSKNSSSDSSELHQNSDDGNSILNASLHSLNFESGISASSSPFVPSTSNSQALISQDKCPIIQFKNSIWSHKPPPPQNNNASLSNSEQQQKSVSTQEASNQQKVLSDLGQGIAGYHTQQFQNTISIPTGSQMSQIISSPLATQQIILNHPQEGQIGQTAVAAQPHNMMPQIAQASVQIPHSGLMPQQMILPPSQIQQQYADFMMAKYHNQQIQLQQLLNQQINLQGGTDLPAQQLPGGADITAQAQSQQLNPNQQHFIQMQQQQQLLSMQQMQHQGQVPPQPQGSQQISPQIQHHQQQFPHMNGHQQQQQHFYHPQHIISNDPNLEHNVQLQHLYVNRQINRHMLNPLYKMKHKLESQNSFHRTSSPHPMFFLPGNLSVIKPPPGFEHTIPQNIMQSQIVRQILQNVQLDIHQKQALLQGLGLQCSINQVKQLEADAKQQLVGIQPSQLQHNQANQLHFQMIQQQQQYQQYQAHQMQHQFQTQVIQSQHQQIQQQQQQSNITQPQQQLSNIPQPNTQLSSPRQQQHLQVSPDQSMLQLKTPRNSANSVDQQPLILIKSESQNQNYYSSYTNFFEQVQTKKSALDEQLKKTTFQIERKLKEQLEMQHILDEGQIQNPGETDQDEDEDQEDLDALSIKSDTQSQNEEEYKDFPESNLNMADNEDSKCLLVSNFRSSKSFQVKQKPSSNNNSEQNLLKQQVFQQKQELYSKLKEQLNKIKNDMFATNDTPTNSLNPFKQDPSTYLEKILNLVTIFNEVDSQSSLEKLKTKYDKTKVTLDKVRKQKLKFFQSLTSVNNQLHYLENNYQTLADENNYLRDKQQQEREQLEFLIKQTYEKIRDIAEKGNIDLSNFKMEDHYFQCYLRDGTIAQNLNSEDNKPAIFIQDQEQCTKARVDTSDKSTQCEQMSPEVQQKPPLAKIIHAQMGGDSSVPTGGKQQQQYRKLSSFKMRELIGFGELPEGQQKQDDSEDEYCKKITEQQIEIENLKDYIKKRSLEYSLNLADEKQRFDKELADVKSLLEAQVSEQQQQLKEKDLDLRVMRDHVLRVDPNYFSNLFQTSDRIKECQDCKARDAKIQELELRITDITNYIKKTKDAKTLEQIFQVKQEVPPQPQSPGMDLTPLIKPSVELLQGVSKLFQLLQIKYEASFNEGYKEIISSSIAALSKLNSQGDEESKTTFEEEKSLQFHQLPTTKDTCNSILATIQLFQSIKVNALPQQQQQQQQQPSSKANQSINQVKEDLGGFDLGQITQISEKQMKEQHRANKQDRMAIHQIIVSVEKLLYQLNGIFINEQVLLESSSMLQLNQQPQKRQELNAIHKELMQKILEQFLQLPLKLKLVFDSQKSFESFQKSIINHDASPLEQIAKSIIVKLQPIRESKCDCTSQQALSTKQNEELKMLRQQSDTQIQKIQQLTQDLVKVKSAYSALEIHLNSKSAHSSRKNSATRQDKLQQHSTSSHTAQMFEKIKVPDFTPTPTHDTQSSKQKKLKTSKKPNADKKSNSSSLTEQTAHKTFAQAAKTRELQLIEKQLPQKLNERQVQQLVIQRNQFINQGNQNFQQNFGQNVLPSPMVTSEYDLRQLINQSSFQQNQQPQIPQMNSQGLFAQQQPTFTPMNQFRRNNQ